MRSVQMCSGPDVAQFDSNIEKEDRARCLGALTTETAGEGQVLGLDGNTLSVDSSQVRVLEKRNEVGLSSLLERHDGGRLETEIGLEVLGDFTDETLEGELADKQLRRLLIPSNFTESDSTGPEPMGLLYTTSGSLCGLAGCLGGELLTGGLASGRFAGGLLSTGH